MRLSTKLILSFSALLLLLAINSVVGYRNISSMYAETSELANNWLPSIEAAGRLDSCFQAMRRLELVHVIVQGSGPKAKYEQEIDAALAALRETQATYEPLISSEEERRVYGQFKDNLSGYLRIHEDLLRLSRADKDDEALAVVEGSSRSSFFAAMDNVKRIIAINNKNAKEAAIHAASVRDQVVEFSLGFAALGLLFGIGVAVGLIRNVFTQLGADPMDLHALAAEVATGNLDVDFACGGSSVQGVCTIFANMVDTLKVKIHDADDKAHMAEEATDQAKSAQREAEEAKARADMARREGMLQAAGVLERVVERVVEASRQISIQVEQSTNNVDAQRSRVAETASSMTQMNASVVEVAQSASRAAEVSEQAQRKAREGSDVVQGVVAAIGEVNSFSRQVKVSMDQLGVQAQGIGQIMNVISDIADQTNLLALNAAIEAARAGDAGRGFAVVADEVRKLAEKTMSATKEVGEAISAIQGGATQSITGVEQAVRAIEKANEQAHHAGEALGEIVDLSASSSDQVRAIATASEEQSAASEEISRTVEDINRFSSETAQAMNESSSAVGALADQAQELQKLVDQLRNP